MGFKKNLELRIVKVKDKSDALFKKAKPKLKRVLGFLNKNKGFIILTVTTVSPMISNTTLLEFAKLVSDSTLITIAGKEYRKVEALSILRKLKEWEIFTVCDFEPLVRDLDLSDVMKVRKLNAYLGSIENIGNIDLKNHQVICIVTTLASLYFSNCSNFNSIIEGLLNALKRGYLSRRLFEIIMAMLTRRGVPVQEILEMIKNRE